MYWPRILPSIVVVGLPAERVRLLAAVVPAGAAGRDEQVRHLRRVQVVHHLAVRRRAQAAPDREDLVLQHELLDDAHGLGRVVAVVLVDQVDLAAVHAAVCVHVVEVRLRRRRDLAVARRGRAGQRLVRADQHRCLRHARRRTQLAAPAPASGGHERRRHGDERAEALAPSSHASLLLLDETSAGRPPAGPAGEAPPGSPRAPPRSLRSAPRRRARAAGWPARRCRARTRAPRRSTTAAGAPAQSRPIARRPGCRARRAPRR